MTTRAKLALWRRRVTFRRRRLERWQKALDQARKPTPTDPTGEHPRQDLVAHRDHWRKLLAQAHGNVTRLQRKLKHRPHGPAKGIDVSNNNGHVDWAKIRAAGFKFAWAKASEGLTFNDLLLIENVRGARTHGIKIGAYHFLTAGSSPESQAWHFAGRIRAAGLHKADLLPVVDVEAAGVTPAMAERFADEFHREIGVYPVVYTFPAFAPVWPVSITRKCKLWIANFGVRKPTIPRPWPPQAVWQFSSTGHVPGVARLCDLNTTDHLERLLWT
jgi:lysozyme